MPGLLTVIPEVIQGVNANSVLGNNTGSAGQCVEMTAAQTRALLGLDTTDSPTFAGATFTGNVLFSSNSNLGDTGGNHVSSIYALNIYHSSGGGRIQLGGSDTIFYQPIRVATGSHYLGWSTGAKFYQPTTYTIETRDGTNPILQQWFNTYTDASNNEYLEAGFDTDIAYIRTVANGTGTSRKLVFDSATGVVGFNTGNTVDFDLTTDDDGFINFQATADADATSAISTLTTSGATTHHIQIEINGTTAWIAASTTDPS